MTGTAPRPTIADRVAAVERRLSAFTDRIPTIQVRVSLALVLFMYFVAYNLFRPGILGVPIPNVASLGSLMVMGTLPFLGLRALRMTAMDGIIYFWMLLATGSHLYAAIVLQRLMFEQYLLIYLMFLYAVWMMYRIGFAAASLRPRTAVRTFQFVSLACMGAAAVVSILQGIGFTKGPVDSLVELINQGRLDQIVEGNAIGRPTAWLGGPNILGFFNACGVAMIAGWVIVRGRSLTVGQTVLSTMGMGIFAYSCISSQSRQALAIVVIIGVVMLISMLRQRMVVRATSIVGAVTAFGVISIIQGGDRFAYLTSLFSTGVRKDSSVEIRKYFYDYFFRVANDSAVLGTGVAQVNNPLLLGIAGYDYYYVPGIDNEWANMYQAHGFLGLVLVGVIFALFGQAAWRESRHENLERRIFGVQCLLLGLVLLLASPGTVRIAKLDTAGIIFLPFGLLLGLRMLDRTRGDDIRYDPLPAHG